MNSTIKDASYFTLPSIFVICLLGLCLATIPVSANGSDSSDTASTTSANAIRYAHTEGGATSTPTCVEGLTVINSANVANQNNYLQSVSAVTDGDIWSVGYYYTNTGSTNYRTLIEHWNNSTWNIVPSVDVENTYNYLYSVSARSANDVWAVGVYGDSFPILPQAFIQHWNGSAWSVSPNPTLGEGRNTLYGVASVSANDAWAVGVRGYYGGGQTLIERWNGSQWAVVPSPNPGTVDNVLSGVAVVSEDDVWAVGHYTSNSSSGPILTLVEHWNGVQWEVIPSPNPAATGSSLLYSVTALSANDLWAVGAYQSGSGQQVTLIEHWDGIQWSIVASPSPAGFNLVSLNSIDAASSNDVWAVGSAAGASGTRTLIEHWDGTQWSIIASPNPSPISDSLSGVAVVSGNSFWAAGSQYPGSTTRLDQTLVEHYTNNCITSTPTQPTTPTVTRTATQTRTATATATATVAAACSIPEFSRVTNYLVGDNPFGVAVADFNLDNKQDVVVPNANVSSVSVLLGQGNGTFGTSTPYASGNNPYAVISADFNNDTFPDLATANHGGDNISILLGTGNGAFGAAINASVGSYPDALATGDFNQDGKMDLAVANSGSNYLSILLGLGNGSFATPSQIAIGNTASAITVGDFNRDGKSDLAVALGSLGWIEILLGTGDGGFNLAPEIAAPGVPAGIASGDFTNDGKLDLVFVNNNSNSVTLIRGVGDGTFVTPVDYPVRSHPVGIAVADFNLDRKLDFITASLGTGTTQEGLTLWLGRGSGSFYSVLFLDAHSFPNHVATGNFNGDSLPDIAAANGSDDVSILLNLCGGLGTITPSPTPIPTACPLQFADVTSGNTFYPYVRCMACRGIISGYPCGGPGEPCNGNNGPYFRPSSNVTRGQIAKIVALSASITDPVHGQTFEDVPSNSTFYVYVERLIILGVMSGYPCGFPEPCIPPMNRPYFRPNANATRGQLAKIVANTAEFNEPVSGQTFEDVPPTNTFYEFIERLASRGAMSGYTCGNPEACVPPFNRPYFRPGNLVSRGQTAKIVGNTFFPGCATP